MALSIPKPSLPPEYYVDNRVYSDPLCLRHEMERIFLRVWNFFCHDSELSQPGDFLTGSIAGQRVLVCRNEAYQTSYHPWVGPRDLRAGACPGRDHAPAGVRML